MDNKIMMVGALVAILLVGGLLVFMSLPKNVPLENRLTGEKLVKLDGVQKVNFQNQNPLDAAKKFDLTLTACPSTGELVADASLCPVAQVAPDDAINCDGNNFAPVCTPDGHTYTNDCFARSQGANEFQPGVCQADAEDAGAVPAAGGNNPPAAGAELVVQCANGELVADATLCPAAQQPGQPPAGAAANCNNNREPVCDVANGFTYLNSCFANAAGVANPQAGACQAPAGQQPGQQPGQQGGSLGDAPLPPGVSEEDVAAPDESAAVLTTGATVRVNRIYGFDQTVGQGAPIGTSTIDKFIVMSVTVKNTGTAALANPIPAMKVYGSKTDTLGQRCEKRASEVMTGAFAASDIAPGEVRTGLVACSLLDNANQISFDYQGAKINLFDYVASASSLVKKGPVGQKLTNVHLGFDVTVDSVQYYADPDASPNGGFNYRGVHMVNNKCINDGPVSSRVCRLVILNVTVRNSAPLPWTRSLPLKNFKLKLEGETSYLRDFEQSVTPQLDKALNLDDMAYGDVRTGQIAYPVGDIFLDGDFHLNLIVQDKDGNWRGSDDVTIK